MTLKPKHYSLNDHSILDIKGEERKEKIWIAYIQHSLQFELYEDVNI